VVAVKGEGRYRAVIERDESGAWIARVPGVRGCHSYGRTLDQARRRLREALGLWVDDADSAELIEEIRLPARVRTAINRSRTARHSAKRQRDRAQLAMKAAAETLVEEVGLGLRDAGELLEISHQRVQQLVKR
jgi:predicted RNase H-like HicB family nuclease